MEGSYLHNFIQATFNALLDDQVDLSSGSLLIGGDGRYFNNEAIQIIVKMAVANGCRRVVIGQNGLLSTPAVSALIREKGPLWKKSFGALILTASHNPGGPDEDFGVKYNCENGGPAPEKLTNAIHDITKTISSFVICENFPDVDLESIGSKSYVSEDGNTQMNIDIVSTTDEHINLLESIFDFNAISKLIKRSDSSFKYDCMCMSAFVRM